MGAKILRVRPVAAVADGDEQLAVGAEAQPRAEMRPAPLPGRPAKINRKPRSRSPDDSRAVLTAVVFPPLASQHGSDRAAG